MVRFYSEWQFANPDMFTPVSFFGLDPDIDNSSWFFCWLPRKLLRVGLNMITKRFESQFETCQSRGRECAQIDFRNCQIGPYLHLDELIDQFLGLSESIAQAINSDENIELVRHMDKQLSEVFDAIVSYEPEDLTENLRRTQFLIDQIVESDDQYRRQRLAEHLKNTISKP